MKKIVIVALIVLLAVALTVGVFALGIGNVLYQFQVLLNCRTDFFCRPEPTIVPAMDCEELDQDSGYGYWIQQVAVADPRTGGTTICVTNGSGTTGSLLFAKEVISGHSLESRHLWNADQARIDGVPYVEDGPNGFTLFIPMRVNYPDGSFTTTHRLLLSEELPIPSD